MLKVLKILNYTFDSLSVYLLQTYSQILADSQFN